MIYCSALTASAWYSPGKVGCGKNSFEYSVASILTILLSQPFQIRLLPLWAIPLSIDAHLLVSHLPFATDVGVLKTVRPPSRRGVLAVSQRPRLAQCDRTRYAWVG